VELDRLEELDVADRPAEAHAELRVDLAEAALLHEDALLLGMDELDDVRIRGKVPARLELRHLGVDGLQLELAGDGNAMVAVDHEVRVAELVGDDGREGRVGECPLDLLPAVAEAGSPRLEIAVEVAPAAVRPDDLLHRDRSETHVAPRERPQTPGGLVEREEVA
jgi:hypothetical protein